MPVIFPPYSPGGGGGASPPPASTTVSGIVKLSTILETTDGVNATNATTPIGVLNAIVAQTVDHATDADLTAGLAAKANIASPTFTGVVGGVTKAHVGLANVDNTADTAKPISTATQTALNAKANTASPTFTGTVTGVTKTHVGLGNVDNTSDANKPVSTAQANSIATKAVIVAGTGMTTSNRIVIVTTPSAYPSTVTGGGIAGDIVLALGPDA